MSNYSNFDKDLDYHIEQHEKEEEESSITYELPCIICKRVIPITTMIFRPFMKGGVCHECRYQKRK